MLRALPHTFKSQIKLHEGSKPNEIVERERMKKFPTSGDFYSFFFSLEIRSPSLLSEANLRENLKSIFLKLELGRKRIEIN